MSCSMSNLTLADLMKMVSKVQEIADGSDKLEVLMDKYDISDLISGRNRSISYPQSPFVKGEVLFSLPSASFQTSWINYYPSPSINNIVWGAGSDTTEDAEATKKREQEQLKKTAKFERLIDKISTSPSELLKDPDPKSPVHRSPDYIQTLTGWRGWDVYDGRLCALRNCIPWEPRKSSKAECAYHIHEAPRMECSCGYWSFKSSDLMKKALHAYQSLVMVVGSVEIWGKVIECENGYRSEFSYPKELWLLRPGLESLSWTYGVPVRKS